MNFNVDKCSVLVVNTSQSSLQASYSLDGNPLQISQETKYLGVVIQSNLKFINHIYTKIGKLKQQLGMIKGILFKASEKAKLLAYIDLCCLGPQARVVPDSIDQHTKHRIAHKIEMVQQDAVRFISRLRGRDSITSTPESFNLETLAARHKKTRHSLLLKLLGNE